MTLAAPAPHASHPSMLPQERRCDPGPSSRASYLHAQSQRKIHAASSIYARDADSGKDGGTPAKDDTASGGSCTPHTGAFPSASTEQQRQYPPSRMESQSAMQGAC